MKTALITGATSGIGKASAYKLATDYKLIICGRREEILKEIEKELSKETEVITLCFDVRDKESVFSKINSLPKKWKKIDLLINNAGNAHGLAPFDKADLSDLEAMIDGNVKGLIYVSKAVLPFMIPQKSGHIVNVSSIAGKQVYANGTTYCASKWAVEALSKGMRLDLLPHGIKVTNVAPGAVETEFSLVRFKGDEKRAEEVYSGYEALTAEDLAESIYFAVTQPEHVQIADLTIFPKAQADGITFKKN